MPPLSKERVKALVAEWRESARRYIARYAAEQAPHVGPNELRAVQDALGEVSVDEAMAVLHRLEADAIEAEAPR